MMGQRQRQFVLGSLPRSEHMAAGDQPPVNLINDDGPAKLHGGAPFVAGDDLGVRLEEADHLFRGGHGLLLQHAAARLMNDPFGQRHKAGDLLP